MCSAAEIVRIAEPEIDAELAARLCAILRECFPDYPERSYFKLPPHFRFVATVGGAVVAQVGVELRIIRVGDRVLRTFGVVDLCVTAEARSHGLAGRLLAAVLDHARACAVEFVVLFADDDRVYTRHGWSRKDNRVTWVKIHEHTTLGLTERTDTEALIVRAVTDARWPDGDVDLLGHLY